MLFQGSITYTYIDQWSSVYTWGGTAIPAEGDFIVIKAGQTILFDVASTPKLAMVLIQGALSVSALPDMR